MVFRIIRVGLIISVLLHLGFAIYLSLQDKVIGQGELTNEIAKRMEFIFYAVLTFILTFTMIY
jgi:succinate dehydrogenase/fumarate reductase cytochrome b subunit